ncbi:MAG: hypothetical protein NVSMB56_10310 [Pyrinomonadaceae bacterium]
MSVRFQADVDLNTNIVLAVIRRAPAVDFQTANIANLKSLSDTEVLEIAARENRLLVSHDQTTMPDHFAQFISKRTSSGLLIVPQHLSLSLVVEELLIIWTASEAHEWLNRIAYLPL